MSKKTITFFRFWIVALLIAVAVALSGLLPYTAFAETESALTELPLGELHGGSVNDEGGNYIFNRIQSNNIAVFDAYTVEMEYSADVTVTDGSAALGLVFGAGGLTNFGNQWYALHIQPENNCMRLFCEADWNSGGLDSGRISLASGILSGTVRLKITVDAQKNIKCFVGDMSVPAYETVLSGYSGGYVGLMTYDTGAEFTGVTLKGNPSPKLAYFEIDGAYLTEGFSPDLFEYTATAEEGATSVRIKAGGDGVLVYADGKLLQDGQFSEPINLTSEETVITVEITDKNSGISRAMKINVKKPRDFSGVYKEVYRPQFHFSPMQFWNNDPNGLVYNAETGEYHQFYQYNPGVLYHDGQSHWGHSVSKDLVHWTELPVALFPDDIGVIFSGCMVIDRDNTSGLFSKRTPSESRMVAIFTYHTGVTNGNGGNERQAVAYSEDNGLTWKKYENNSVIPNYSNMYGVDFRDPKVLWMEESNEWLMVVAGGETRLFTSPDLLEWTLNSSVSYKNGNRIYTECPDLFALPVDGNENDVKWVLSGGGVFYVIGRLEKNNGKYEFIAESERRSFYEGSAGGTGSNDWYATQSFSNMPDGRTVLVNWVVESNANNLAGYGKVWNGSLSTPLEAKLITVNGQTYLATYPVAELDTLRCEKLYENGNITVSPGDSNMLAGVNGRLLDIVAEFTLNGATEFGFNLRVGGNYKTVVKYNAVTGTLTVDKSRSGVLDTGIKTMTVGQSEGGKVKLRILLDSSIIDVFANDGITAIGTVYYPADGNTGMEFFTVGGNVTVDSMVIYEMGSAWEGAEPQENPPYLTSITITGGKLNESYNPQKTEYTVIVPQGTKSINARVIFADGNSVYCKFAGKNIESDEKLVLQLSEGENKFAFRVGDTQAERIYTLTVIYEEDEAPPAPTESEGESGGNTVLYAVLGSVGGALVLGAVIAFAVIYSRSKKKKSNGE